MKKPVFFAWLHRFFQCAPLVLAFTALVLCLAIAGCGGSSRTAHLSAPLSPIATVPYVAPTLVPVRQTPTPLSPTPTSAPSQPSAVPTAVPTATAIPGPRPDGGVPNINGQLILVNLNQQWLWVYQDRHLIFTTAITSGRPELPTPTGIYHVQQIYANLLFISGWPPSSPYYYAPEQVNHALYFLYSGYYLHDAAWRRYFGPGTNYLHTNPDGTTETGSHGCVEMTPAASAWLATSMNVGATIDITGSTPQPPATPVPPTATAALPTATVIPPTSPPSGTPHP